MKISAVTPEQSRWPHNAVNLKRVRSGQQVLGGSVQRLVVMVSKDVQYNVKAAAPDVIAAADHKALRDVTLGCVQNGNQGLGVSVQ